MAISLSMEVEADRRLNPDPWDDEQPYDPKEPCNPEEFIPKAMEPADFRSDSTESSTKRHDRDPRSNHYALNGLNVEAIDVIHARARELDPLMSSENIFNILNALKYLLRLGKKDDIVRELEKVVIYVNMTLNSLED